MRVAPVSAVLLCLACFPASAGDLSYARGVSGQCLPAAITAALDGVARACGPVTVISTFRRGAVVAGTHSPSYHRSCLAADFRVRDYACALRVLSDWPGGLSTDPHRVRPQHIHIDNGRQIRFVHGRRKVRVARR